jgi:hypothetical protein
MFECLSRPLRRDQDSPRRPSARANWATRRVSGALPRVAQTGAHDGDGCSRPPAGQDGQGHPRQRGPAGSRNAGPPLDDLASRASRICSHLRKPNHRDAAISDDASLRCGRVARGEARDLVCREQRRSRACLRYRGDRARQAKRCPTPIHQGPRPWSYRACSGRCLDRPRRGPRCLIRPRSQRQCQPRPCIATEHEDCRPVSEAPGHAIGDGPHDGRDRVRVQARGLRVDPPTEAGNISLIHDRDASSPQGTQQAGSPQGLGPRSWPGAEAPALVGAPMTWSHLTACPEGRLARRAMDLAVWPPREAQREASRSQLRCRARGRTASALIRAPLDGWPGD